MKLWRRPSSTDLCTTAMSLTSAATATVCANTPIFGTPSSLKPRNNLQQDQPGGRRSSHTEGDFLKCAQFSPAIVERFTPGVDTGRPRSPKSALSVRVVAEAGPSPTMEEAQSA